LKATPNSGGLYLSRDSGSELKGGTAKKKRTFQLWGPGPEPGEKKRKKENLKAMRRVSEDTKKKRNKRSQEASVKKKRHSNSR